MMSSNDLFDDFMEYKMSSVTSSDKGSDEDGKFPTLQTSNRAPYKSTSTLQENTRRTNNNDNYASHVKTNDTSRLISTVIMLFIVLSFISGKLPVNGVTGILALICAGILVFRFLKS